MDIYEYLKMDHAKVNHLFKLFDKAPSKKRQQEIVALLSQELLVHAHSEQETFYKELAQHQKTGELALHGKHEHREIEDQIERITHASGNHWREGVLKLKEIVEHHVKEEEGKMFRKAKNIISAKEAMILKEKMHYLKGKLLLSLRQETSKKLSAEKKIPHLVGQRKKNAHMGRYAASKNTRVH